MSDIPSLTRPAFFDGQALTADDLTAVQDYHRDLLWLHQRTLHGWGVASGFAVAGSTGATSVTVQPGYALDQDGHSIVLSAAATLAVPQVVAGPTGAPAAYYLTVAWVDDDDLAPTVRTGVCGTNGAVRRAESPLLRWQEASSVDIESVVVLGSISVLNCKLALPVATAVRRSAIPDRQPYIYAGQTAQGGTQWGLYRLPDQSPDDAPVGLTISVNTAEAGFANTPRYSAHIVGTRAVRATAVPAVGEVGAVLDGFVQLSAASSAGFDLTIVLPQGIGLVNPAALLTTDVLATLPAKLGWYVSWLGVEG